MADSLTGAVQNSSTLDSSTKNILTSVVNNIDTSQTPVSVTTAGGTTVVQGNTSDGQTIGAVVPTAESVVVPVNNGNFVADVTLPGETGLGLQGLAETTNSSGAQTYFNQLINSALPQGTDPAANEQRSALQNAVNLVTDGLGDGQNLVVRVLSFIDNNGSNANSGQLVVNGGNTASGLNNVVAVNTSGLSNDQTVVLENIPRAVIVGAGSVQLSGTANGVVVGDNNNQSIVGGAGNDTLVGGGGNDTLVGGNGNNTFAFNSGGHYTVTDFNPSKDKLTFMISGVSNIDQLGSLVTSQTTNGNSTTYNFGPNNSLTIDVVGSTPFDVNGNVIFSS